LDVQCETDTSSQVTVIVDREELMPVSAIHQCFYKQNMTVN